MIKRFGTVAVGAALITILSLLATSCTSSAALPLSMVIKSLSADQNDEKE